MATARLGVLAMRGLGHPHCRNRMSFYKHVHGDNGAGFNTSHQTGWSSTVARLMHPFVTNAAEQVLLVGEAAAVTDVRA